MTPEDAILTVRRRGHPHAGGRSCRDRGNERRPGDERRGHRPGCGSHRRSQVANYNCPGQIVITGEETAVAAAGEALKAAGARRVIPLKVSGPFHCELLKGAGKNWDRNLRR